MPPKYVPHERILLKRDPHFNEAWLHDRICDDPSVLGLGDVRVLDRERAYLGGGRLDLLLFDDDSNRRYEVEIMLGQTDPSHIIRTIEYWDIERRRYPGYEHVAVLIAEDITSRFLNVMSLLAGSIPLIAIQLNALRVDEHILLSFVTVLNQVELRVDDTDDDGGGGQVDRAFWEQKAGPGLLSVCDRILGMINETAEAKQDFNYLRGYIGLRSHGVVSNFIHFSPKRTKRFVHVYFRIEGAPEWAQKFEDAAIAVRCKREGRFRISITPEEADKHAGLLREAVHAAVSLFDS